MFYVQEITVPAQTPEATPVELVYPICHGVIHRVELEFEKWCANLLHVRIYRFEQQIYPMTPLSSFASDGETIGFNDYFQVFEDPYTLRIRAWNDDDSYAWSARIRVGVMPEGVASHMFGEPTAKDIEELRKAFGLPTEGE